MMTWWIYSSCAAPQWQVADQMLQYTAEKQPSGLLTGIQYKYQLIQDQTASGPTQA